MRITVCCLLLRWRSRSTAFVWRGIVFAWSGFSPWSFSTWFRTGTIRPPWLPISWETKLNINQRHIMCLSIKLNEWKIRLCKLENEILKQAKNAEKFHFRIKKSHFRAFLNLSFSSWHHPSYEQLLTASHCIALHGELLGCRRRSSAFVSAAPIVFTCSNFSLSSCSAVFATSTIRPRWPLGRLNKSNYTSIVIKRLLWTVKKFNLCF